MPNGQANPSFWVLTMPRGAVPRAEKKIVAFLKGESGGILKAISRDKYVLARPAQQAMRARYDALRVPILGWSFEDDAIITKPAVDDLHGFYRHAAVERRHVAPRERGRERLGHFGYFLPPSRADLWAETIAWLRARVAG